MSDTTYVTLDDLRQLDPTLPAHFMCSDCHIDIYDDLGVIIEIHEAHQEYHAALYRQNCSLCGGYHTEEWRKPMEKDYIPGTNNELFYADESPTDEEQYDAEAADFLGDEVTLDTLMSQTEDERLAEEADFHTLYTSPCDDDPEDDMAYEHCFGPFYYNDWVDQREFGVRIPYLFTLEIGVSRRLCWDADISVAGGIMQPWEKRYPLPYLSLIIGLFGSSFKIGLGNT